MTAVKKLLGQRIKEIRKSRRMTQEHLAEIVGIGTSNISYIETGKFAPSIENFEKIANALNVEPYELYKFPAQKTNEQMKEELINAMNKDNKLLKLMYKFYQALK